MTPFGEMVTGARTCACVFSYVERGKFANFLGDLELAAAKDAFSRIPTALDKRGQVQICIGHLNSSFTNYSYTVESAGLLERTLITSGVKILSAQIKACFVLCIRSICYAYIGETVHWQQDLDMAEELLARELVGGPAALWFISGVVNPLVAVDALYAMCTNFRATNDDDYKVDVDLIRKLREVLQTSAE